MIVFMVDVELGNYLPLSEIGINIGNRVSGLEFKNYEKFH